MSAAPSPANLPRRYPAAIAGVRMPDHFPRTKGCANQASALFECVHVHTRQTPDMLLFSGDPAAEAPRPAAAARAARTGELAAAAEAQCDAALAAYNACMKKALVAFPQRLERVSDAYRRQYSHDAPQDD